MRKKINGHAPVLLNKGERGMLRRSVISKRNKLKRKPANKRIRQAIAYCESILCKIGSVCKYCGQVVD